MTTGQITSEDRSLVEELYRPLQRYAAVVAPAGVEGDDLLQEALVRVLRKRRLGELEFPAAYLKKTMVHLAANKRRHAATKQRVLTRWAASERSHGMDDYPSDLVDLMGLSAAERAVLYLNEIEGYSFGEIAQILGCTSQAARKRASRGRRRLQLAMTAEGGR